MNFLYILGIPLGYVMEVIYKLIPNYGWDIILFTLLVRLISIPLQLSQQKNTAKMSAFQPMIQDIQKKYRDNQEKMSEEMTKLQQDFGYNPYNGCLPMVLNFFILFGVIDVVYRPLQRILHVSSASMSAAADVLGVATSNYQLSSKIISAILSGDTAVAGTFAADELEKINEFASHMDFLGIDLTATPQLVLSATAIPLLIFPVLSFVTMMLSTHFSMQSSGQQMDKNMKMMMYAMPLMYVFICFTVPVAFSLYYTISNVFMMAQSIIMKKIYDPEKIRKQVEAEIEQKRKEQKRGVKNTTVKVKNEKTGAVEEVNLSASEMNRRRLEYARKLDEERYKDERTVPLSELNADNTKKSAPEEDK